MVGDKVEEVKALAKENRMYARAMAAIGGLLCPDCGHWGCQWGGSDWDGESWTEGSE